MTVGERIKQKRIELELSQTELAKRAGYCDKTVISKFENAGDKISMKQIERLAKALNTTSKYLMGWVQEQQSKKGRAYELFGDKVGEIIERDTAIAKAREYYFLNRHDDFESDPTFWDSVEKYLKYRFIVHLWNIDFDETIMTKEDYYEHWKIFTIDNLCRPSILLDDEKVCNAVRKKYGLPKRSYDDFYMGYKIDNLPSNEQLIEVSKKLNKNGMDKLIAYAKDLTKIYQYCNSASDFEEENV